MGKTLSRGMIAPDYMNAAQAAFFHELREASAKRQERAEFIAACIAGVALGVIISAIQVAFPFLPY